MSRIEKQPTTLIIQNPRAGIGNAPEIADRLSQRLPKVEICSLTELEKGEIKNIPNKVILVGGDGTFHYAISWLNKHGEKPFIFIAGGGTGNILRKMLEKEKTVVSLDELVKDGEELLKQTIAYQAGIIKNDSDHEDSAETFTLSLGFGTFEKCWVEAMEKIRPYHQLKSSGKLYGAGLVTLTQICNRRVKNEPLLCNYSLGPFLGPFQVFKNGEVSLKNDNIGFTEIKDRNPTRAAFKLALTLLLWQYGYSNIPYSLATRGYGREWREETRTSKNANIDGDLKHLPQGDFTIKKNGTIFSIAALSEK